MLQLKIITLDFQIKIKNQQSINIM